MQTIRAETGVVKIYKIEYKAKKRVIRVKEKVVFGLIAIVIPLTIGAVLYYLLCPDVWFVKVIDYHTNFNMHISCDVSQKIIIRTIRNYFFDYIWAFAFINALYLINNGNANALMIDWFISIFVGCVLEILQYIGIAKGTFDIFDILVEILGVFSAVIIIHILRRKKKDEKN